MHCIKTSICMLLLCLICSTSLADSSYGSKLFGCFEMEWDMTPDHQVNVRFVINDETLSRFTLSPDEPFRQFYLSSETNTAEGRLRVRYKPSKGKAYLKMDSFIYRCSSPNERSYSGILAEFAIPASQPVGQK